MAAKIIQVGIVIIEDGQIIDTYATDVNPHEALTDHISSLTGLTDEQLAKAPDFAQVARPIYQLLEDCIFVAHNVTFDANLLAEALFFEGYDLQTPRVDTVELAQVFFPTFEKYSLTALAEQLGIELADAHTAIADAMATAELFLHLLAKIKSLPKITLEKLLDLSDALLYETGMVIQWCFEEQKSPYLPENYLESSGIVVKKPNPPQLPRKLSEAFETNLALLGFDVRPLQQQFSQAIAEGWHQQIPSFIQAPAGIGKTLGYLLTLLSHHQGEQLVVSVPTKVLQDQLMLKEGALLQEVFHITPVSLKGAKNYISLDAFAATWSRQDNRLANRYKLQILVWLLETTTGDLDEIRQKQRFEAYFDEIRHDGRLVVQSPFKDMDFWAKQQSAAKRAAVVVTNHAYLLARNAEDPRFLAGKVLVIDEAQTFLLALERASQTSIDLNVCQKAILTQLETVSHQLPKRLLESLAFSCECFLQAIGNKSYEPLSDEAIAPFLRDLRELAEWPSLALNPLLEQDFSQYWLEKTADSIFLKATSLDTMALLEVLPPLKKLYGISATLEISPNVSLPFLLGITDYHHVLIPSQRNQQQLIAIPADLPPIKSLSESAYSQWLSKMAVQLAKCNQPTVILFTSKKLLLAVSQELEQLGVRHLTQEKNGSATTVKRRFDRGEAHILLGTGAFWEGVDFAQQDRLLVVITRLPFDNPKSPQVQKMIPYLREKGRRPFDDYVLPVMVLRLIQALGRSKRRPEQRSVLLVLDNRVLTAPYGSVIRQSLEKEGLLQVQNFSEILTGISDFLI